MNSEKVFITVSTVARGRKFVSFTFVSDQYEAETRINSLYEFKS
tara:strand:+ start:659 stop:790 length:132 start_codon:yes stop_codon:yes gene_type:complete